MVSRLLKDVSTQKMNFQDVLAYIEEHYIYLPSVFHNGALINIENENQGSARVLYFGKLMGLSVEQTLKLFAEHYISVLASPQNTDHQNIRQFMQHGWERVRFEREVLLPKSAILHDKKTK